MQNAPTTIEDLARAAERHRQYVRATIQAAARDNEQRLSRTRIAAASCRDAIDILRALDSKLKKTTKSDMTTRLSDLEKDISSCVEHDEKIEELTKAKLVELRKAKRSVFGMLARRDACMAGLKRALSWATRTLECETQRALRAEEALQTARRNLEMLPEEPRNMG